MEFNYHVERKYHFQLGILEKIASYYNFKVTQTDQIKIYDELLRLKLFSG